VEWLLGFLSSIFLFFSLRLLYNKYNILTSYLTTAPVTSGEIGLSLVLCTHGQAPRIQGYLEKIILQDYSLFEIILVCKNSPKDILDALHVLSSQHSMITVINITDKELPFKEKKQALNMGISRAKYEWIVTIDDDCYPFSDNWLSSINRHSQHLQADLLLGLSPYISQSSLLNQWVRYDALQTAINYTYHTLIGKPFMGVGRNMAFKKELWSEAYLKEYELLGSGDATTLIQFYRTKKRVSIFLYPVVYSFPIENFSSWIKQKLRHIRNGQQMGKSTNITLAEPLLYSFLFWFFLWIWISYFAFHFIIFGLIVLYLFSKTFFHYKISHHFQWKTKPVFYTCFFDAFYNFSLLILPFFSVFIKNKWRN